MYRLKLTQKNGLVFLGPFVYDFSEEDMKKKVKQMNWIWLKRIKTDEGIKLKKTADLEFFEVTTYPKNSIFDPDSAIWDREEDLIRFINNLEEQWEELTKGEEDDYREDT